MYCSSCGERLSGAPPTVCTTCGAAHWLNPKPGASALICSTAGALLLVKRASDPWRGYWDVPGGFCEAAEHPSATAIREAREEAGVEIELTGLLGMWIDRYGLETPGLAPEHVLAIYYCARATGTSLFEPDPAEVSAVKWFAADELPRDIAFPGHLPLVLDAWRTQRGLNEAEHDYPSLCHTLRFVRICRTNSPNNSEELRDRDPAFHY